MQFQCHLGKKVLISKFTVQSQIINTQNLDKRRLHFIQVDEDLLNIFKAKL